MKITETDNINKDYNEIDENNIKYITDRPNKVLKTKFVLKKGTFECHISKHHSEYSGLAGSKLIENALKRPYYIVREGATSGIYLLRPISPMDINGKGFYYTRIPMEKAIYHDNLVYDTITAITDAKVRLREGDEIIYDSSDFRSTDF